jgi:bacterioferritin
MKGDKKLIDVLNDLLSDELTAISQYMVHSEMCNHWGYGELHGAIEKRAFDEMHHAEGLIERILFLEGTPVVSNLKELRIGKTIPAMVKNDLQAELEAVEAYNKAIALAADAGDEGTADALVGILKDEEAHVDLGEKQLAQIEQMGLENFLTLQASTGEE